MTTPRAFCLNRNPVELTTLIRIADTPDRVSVVLARLGDNFTEVTVIGECTDNGVMHLDVEVSF